MPLSSLRTLLPWFAHTWQGYRLQALLNAVIGIAVVGLDLGFVWSTKLAVDVVTHVRSDVALSSTFLLLGIIVALQVLMGLTSRWVRATLGVKAQNRMQAVLFARLLAARWTAVRRFHTGDLLNRTQRDVSDLVLFLTEHVPALLTTLVQLAGAFTFLFLMDRALACLVLIILPFFILCSKLYVRRMRRITHDIRQSESCVQAIVQESLQHALVIKTLQRAPEQGEKLARRQRRLRGEVIARTKYATISSGLLNTGFAAGYLLTFTWGVYGLSTGALTYGALIAFIQLVAQIQAPVRALSRFVPIFIGAFTAAERIIEIERIPLEEHGEAESVDTLFGTGVKALGIRANDLSYTYAEGGRSIFSHFNLDLPPGSVVALIGETGSGKTTFVRLLLALLRPSAGALSLYATTQEGGECEKSVSAAMRGCYAYVPQGNTLLSGTVEENLRLGNPLATEEEMREALHCAAADFILARPEGLATRCGEMGDGLSEGQAQRIAIARALLKPGAILVCDEATSALDSETEQTVVARIVQRCKGRTMLFITHRPEVLRYCTHTVHLTRSASHAAG